MRVIERAEVARRLTYEACIPIVRQAMIDFSSGSTRQLLRSIIPLGGGHLCGIMPGALGETAAFGAKLISVYPENFSRGRQSHQGLVVLFEPRTGEPVCIVHAGEITAIRTAAASAVATDALARADVLRQGSEFLKAKEAGLIDDGHIVAEIGEVLAGKAVGRRAVDEITVYKSLGHIVQDLASAWALYQGADGLPS